MTTDDNISQGLPDGSHEGTKCCVRHGTGIFGTGMDAIPNLPKCPVPVLMLYRNYRSVRYRYESLCLYRRYLY